MLRAAMATSGGTDAPDVTYCSIWPWTEAISALTLRSRPTCSGTIISGKITVSRSATIGSTWILSTSRASTCVSLSWASTSRVSSSLTGSGATSLWLSDSIWLYVPSVEVAHRFRFVSVDVTLDVSFIKQVKDADLAERLELEDDLDARQVDPLASGEEADDTHPPDVRLRVEAEVVAPLRAEEAFLFVDPQRPRMDARQFRGDADEVTRPL